MSLQLHRPNERGDIDARPPEPNWRGQLRSPRWGASLRGGRLPALKNPEMNPTPTWISVLFWVGGAAATFFLLLLGYGTGFWH